MATAAEIRNKAAKKLGLFGTGQVLTDNIASDIDAAYAEVYAEIECLGLATWAFDEEVPDALVWAVVAWVAGVRMDEYSIPTERFQRIAIQFGQAEDRIRKLQARPKQGETEHENF